MICKDVEFKWTDEGKEDFKNIKTAISQAPVLHSPDFNKDFYLYTFSSDQSLVAVLTQRDDENNEVCLSPSSALTYKDQSLITHPLTNKPMMSIKK
jgi:hypothetical protein